MRSLQIDNVRGALQLGAIVGLGYLVPTTITIAINPNFPRPFLYSLISGSYFFDREPVSERHASRDGVTKPVSASGCLRQGLQ
jgi:hypothetical protein